MQMRVRTEVDHVSAILNPYFSKICQLPQFILFIVFHVRFCVTDPTPTQLLLLLCSLNSVCYNWYPGNARIALYSFRALPVTVGPERQHFVPSDAAQRPLLVRREPQVCDLMGNSI